MTDVVVVGGGVLGGAIARHAAAEGARVQVASRSPRPHPGLWRRLDVDGRTRMVPAGASVFVALAPGPGDDPDAFHGRVIGAVAARAWREGAASVTVCVDVGAPRVEAGDRGTIVRLPPLLSGEGGCLAPVVRRLREGGVGRLPHVDGAFWPLAAEDAARAAWRLAGVGDARVLRGVARASFPEIGAALSARFGREVKARWFGGLDAHRRRALAAGAESTDAWDDTALGGRLTIAEWAERLPGPRRKR